MSGLERRPGIGAFCFVKTQDISPFTILGRFNGFNDDIRLADFGECFIPTGAFNLNRRIIELVSRLDNCLGIKTVIMRQQGIDTGMPAGIAARIRPAAATRLPSARATNATAGGGK